MSKEAMKLALDALVIADNIALVGVAYTPRSIEAGLLKMRNAATALREALAEQPEHDDPIGEAQDKLIAEQAAQAQPAPVQEREPITDEQRQKIHNETGAGFALIRLVEIYLTEEAAHGIKEST